MKQNKMEDSSNSNINININIKISNNQRKNKDVLTFISVFVFGVILITIPSLSTRDMEEQKERPGKHIFPTPASATARNASNGPRCVPIQADQFRTEMHREPTFFKGGVNTTKWTDMFVPALEQYGWKPVSCENATARVMRLAMRDAKTYKTECGNHDSSEPTTLIFGFPNDLVFSKKDKFSDKVRAYEREHPPKHNNQSSILPLSYHLGNETECSHFFASSDIPNQKWVVKNPLLNGGVYYMRNFTPFYEYYGACKNKKAPIAQEYIRPPLWDGLYQWGFRTYLMLVNTDPLVVVRRLGDVRRCSEPYSKVHDPDIMVRKRATRCNLYIAKTHPMYGKDGGFDGDDVLKPFVTLSEKLGEEVWQKIVDGIDDALKTLSLSLQKDFVKNSKNIKDHNVGHYAIDGMINDQMEVKILELNAAPQYSEYSRRALVNATSNNNEYYPVEFPRMALTALAQFGLSMSEFSVDACVDEHPFMKRLV